MCSGVVRASCGMLDGPASGLVRVVDGKTAAWLQLGDSAVFPGVGALNSNDGDTHCGGSMMLADKTSTRVARSSSLQ